MLVELKIRDYAVIHALSMEFRAGLNTLTGETGAGKSIIVGALSLLLGERASSDVVREGAERAVVEGVFDVSGRPELEERLDELGFERADGFLILRREVAAEGRNRAWINASPATAGVVGELGRALVDLHGQHEHQTLLLPEEQRGILDAYARAEALAADVARLHREASRLRAEREERAERLRELEGRADFLRFQLEEIRGAELDEGEDVRLEEEARRLEHSEELVGESGRIHEELYGGEDAISERLAQLRDVLRSLARIDPSLGDSLTLLEETFHSVVEVGRSMGSYAAGIEHDPTRLEAIRERLDRIQRLRRKYGPELSDVLAKGEELAREVGELDGSALDLDELARKLAAVGDALGAAAAQLTVARTSAAVQLAPEVEALLPELGMPGGTFRIVLRPLPEVERGGGEGVHFEASLNPGFEPRALSRIASGGELSRVMLALKSILARVDRVPTLVFDEIDAGIGGAVATGVATKLREVAEHHQVFVITHLAQLASRGHNHLFVEKVEEDGIATARVTELDGEERVREIARMLGGDPESAVSRDHARELLQPA
ncbi:MAG: DNA repair protein RecN [Gemmatimonadota bacterium]